MPGTDLIAIRMHACVSCSQLVLIVHGQIDTAATYYTYKSHEESPRGRLSDEMSQETAHKTFIFSTVIFKSFSFSVIHIKLNQGENQCLNKSKRFSKNGILWPENRTWTRYSRVLGGRL